MLWTFFSTCLNSVSGIFLANAHVFGKVYFPRLCAPIASVLSAAIKTLIQFALLMAFLAYYTVRGDPVRPSLAALLFPLMTLWIGALGAGFGMILSALTTRYRDLNHVLALVLQLAMYVTPVIYPLSQVPERLRFFFYLNPMSAPMELFRVWFYGAGFAPAAMIVSSLAVTGTVTLLGLILFTRCERTFMDVI
jgi:lipopolysaccharide transport system permease protein